MTPLVKYFVLAWQRSFDYAGRSSRPEYWWFILAYTIIGVALACLSAVADVFYKLFLLYVFASIVPNLPLQIRRLRDAGRAWPWIFISFVPLIGGIWLIVLFCQPSVGPV